MTKDDLKLFIKPPIVTTKRTVLRRLLPRDVDAVYSYARDPLVSRYLLWYPHPDKAYTKAYLSYIDRRYKRAEFYDWGIEYNGKIIGTCGFTSFDIENNSAQIGYVLSSSYWGMGLATEVAKIVIRFGFEYLALNRIEARFIAENTASKRVMEKCHMTFEGIKRGSVQCKGSYRDVGVCSILADEYHRLVDKSEF